MINEFYGFSAAPFTLSPDSRFFYDSRGHKTALSYLRFGLQQGEGFIVITGEIGAGKSTLINRVLDELDRNSIEVAYITTSNINADDILRLIASQFHIDVKGADKATMLRALEGYLTTQRRLGRRVLVIVDEAQNLPFGTIEELRMLSNLSVDGQSAIQCFLVGQPQFKATLADPDMEQLRQRVIASYHLGTLSEPETKLYIEHRMQVVGWTGSPRFTPDAVSMIYRATNGVPRRINNVCSRMLMHGALEQLTVIDGKAAEEILRDMGTEVAESAAPKEKAAAAQAAAKPAEQPAPTVSPELEAKIDDIGKRLDEVVRMTAALERKQAEIGQSVAALRMLEVRIIELEQAENGADTSELANSVQDGLRQMQAMESRISRTLASLPSQAADLSAVLTRLTDVESAFQSRPAAENPAQAQALARVDQQLQDQSDILQDLMTVIMSMLGHRPDRSQPASQVRPN
jgi:general secretion pathway protein A